MKRLIKTLRNQDKKDPEYDLCASINGEYVDIMLDYKGSWSLRYFGYVKSFDSRTKAIDWLEENGVSAMQDQLREY